MADTRAPPRPTVLIVENHVATREGYGELLRAAGLTTIEVATAAQAIRRVEGVRPQIVVADLRLGTDADGLDLCERLKQNPSTTDIPVIVLTGAPGDKYLQQRAEAAGCAILLFKPVDPFALVDEVLRRIR